MDVILDAVQDIVATEPKDGTQPGTVQPDDGETEARLKEEITTLWTEHTRLSADRKVTSKELRLLRARLAQRLYQMKSLLSRPGRGGEWRGWLRERGIPRSSADRLVARYAEGLGTGRQEELHTEAIPEPATPTAERLAASVWSSLKKVLVTGESVVQFIGHLVTAAGVAHEWRSDGLMILNPVAQAADGATGTSEAAGPAPQSSVGGEANPADAPAADHVPQPSGETPAATEGPAAEAAAAPTEAGLAAAPADTGNGNVV